jgi:hypothetical protein
MKGSSLDWRIRKVKELLPQSRWTHFTLSALFFAAAFTVEMFLQWLIGGKAGSWIIFVKFGAIFGLLGAMYGAIYALDIRADSHNFDHPISRIFLCAGLGSLLLFYLQISGPLVREIASPIIMIGALVAGFLGWIGWGLAKYIDF